MTVAMIIAYLALLGYCAVLFALVNEMGHLRTEMARVKKAMSKWSDMHASRADQMEKDIEAAAQVALNAQNIAKNNERRLDRSVVYEHR